ncbi:MAG TPA: (2Fe-2S)-binding protein [Afifellaceae bacterium]|nr:(2Fe-2S)-binding protein [Afifellaceae bacterium]
MEEITLLVNGTQHRINADPATPLLLVLRNNLGLTGAKLGCGLEQCGACAVLVDGVSTLCCAVAAGDFQGKEIVTVEGLAGDGGGNDVQRAYVAASAAQCGYCTPGLVVAVTALLRKSPKPDDAEIREALMPHLCRCGSQPRILRAIKQLVDGG